MLAAGGSVQKMKLSLGKREASDTAAAGGIGGIIGAQGPDWPGHRPLVVAELCVSR